MNDPTAIVSAINDPVHPATYSARHLVQDDTDKWIHLDESGVFSLVDSADLKIQPGVYNQFVGATVNGDLTITTAAGATYQVVSSGGFVTFLAP